MCVSNDSALAGGMSQLRAFIRRTRPAPIVEPAVCFETGPGHQGQVDFAEFRMLRGKRHGLLVVLGYSRLLWLRFYERQTMQTLHGSSSNRQRGDNFA